MERSDRAGRTDGQLFRPGEGDLEPGSVLRMVSADGSAAPFSDLTVLAVYWTDSSGNRIWDDEKLADRRRGREVLMARPYLYATHVGTSCPSWLTGVEELRVDVKRILGEDSMFRVVCTARGSLHGYVK
jgi:hypothetical protein